MPRKTSYWSIFSTPASKVDDLGPILEKLVARVYEERTTRWITQQLSRDNPSLVYFIYKNSNEFVDGFYRGYLIGTRTLAEIRSF